jgi:hypothetical protein
MPHRRHPLRLIPPSLPAPNRSRGAPGLVRRVASALPEQDSEAGRFTRRSCSASSATCTAYRWKRVGSRI